MDIKEKAIIKAVEELSDDIIDLTRRLASRPSTLGEEASAVSEMEGALLDLGYPPIRVPIDHTRLSAHPGYADVPWKHEGASGRNNLVAVVRGRDSGARSALFNGHLDVVSAEPLEHWDTDPYQPVFKDGWMFGRGAGDMKSGVAAMVHALKAVHNAGFSLAGDVILETVIEEECCGNGALACLDAGYDADAVLIPEPFGPTILTHQLGVLWFKVLVSGKAGHVLDTRAGANAIEKLFPIIQALREMEREMNEEERPEGYEDIPHPLNFNAGVVRGGDWPSTVPAFSHLECRMSFFPGTKWESVCRRISRMVEGAAMKDSWLAANPPRVEFFGFRSQGHAIRPDNPALAQLAGCHEALTGSAPESYIATCTTDLRAFVSYGRGNATCYGPVAKNIHGANECVNLDSVIHTAKAYALFLARWCGLSE